jgi:hypothetical protein
VLELFEAEYGKVLITELRGMLTQDDLKHFLFEAERLIKKHGKIRMLCQIHDSHGWELGAFWEDAKFDATHFADIERLAIVGHQKWQNGLAMFCKQFTQAKVLHFDRSEFDQAVQWLWADLPPQNTEDAPLVAHDVVAEAPEESFLASDVPAN